MRSFIIFFVLLNKIPFFFFVILTKPFDTGDVETTIWTRLGTRNSSFSMHTFSEWCISIFSVEKVKNCSYIWPSQIYFKRTAAATRCFTQQVRILFISPADTSFHCLKSSSVLWMVLQEVLLQVSIYTCRYGLTKSKIHFSCSEIISIKDS